MTPDTDRTSGNIRPPLTDAERERWRRADAVFDRLLDAAPDVRASILAESSDDPVLRADIERLLRAHDTDQGVLDRPLDSAKMAATPTLHGRHLGSWRLESELGRGGMAVVWRARNVDESVERVAAVKILTTGSLDLVGRERFRRETGILARLNHPGIVPLLDAGTAEDGTPWLAMTLIDGIRIDDWCRQRLLDTRAIVELCCQIGDAVGHAHRSLVIHRDLKPSNILVDRDGHVHLLDFGIARFADEFSESTRTQWRALTPEYAAPEQHSGSLASTAMDVHGLGALLYALLVGRPPRTPGHGSGIGEDELPLPSRALTTPPAHDPGRRNALRRDLDRVLMRALAIDPARRYPSVDALLADLRRWLTGHPVDARNHSIGYRLRKFVFRHRFGVAAGALLLATLAGGFASTLWQAQKARREAEHASAVKTFLVRVMEAADPTRSDGADPPASELLRRGAAQVRDELADQPALLAEMLTTIGAIQVERGLLADAEESLSSALALHADGNVEDPHAHAETLSRHALLHYEQGRRQLAVQRLREASRLLESAAIDDIELEESIHAHLADMLVVVQASAEAREVASALLGRMRERGHTHSGNFILALRSLAATHELDDDHDRALALLREAVERQRGIAPDNHVMAALENELGVAFYGAGRLDQAEAALVAALEKQHRIYGERHPTPLSTWVNLAGVHLAQGRARSAVGDYRQIVAIQRAVTGEQAHPDLAHSLGFLALAEYRAGELEAALATVAQARATSDTLAEDERMQLRWLPSLEGLLRLESGLPDAQRLLHDPARPCPADLDEATPLTRWLCLARRLDDDELAPACAYASKAAPGDTETAGLEGVDRRWWAVYWLLRQDCPGESSTALRDRVRALALDPDPPFPPWLLQRLTRAGLLP